MVLISVLVSVLVTTQLLLPEDSLTTSRQGDCLTYALQCRSYDLQLCRLDGVCYILISYKLICTSYGASRYRRCSWPEVQALNIAAPFKQCRLSVHFWTLLITQFSDRQAMHLSGMLSFRICNSDSKSEHQLDASPAVSNEVARFKTSS